MKHVPRQDQIGGQSGANVAPAEPDPDVLRLRSVHRAAADLRRGTPVLLTGEAPLILLAAETLTSLGMDGLTIDLNLPTLVPAAARALGYYTRCLDLREDLLKRNPDSAQAARDVMVSHYRLGELEMTLSKFESAIARFRSGIAGHPGG